MSDDGFFGNMPYLATMPSCRLYARAGPAGSNAFFDWSPQHRTLTATASRVTNSSTQTQFPPASLYFDAAGSGAMPLSAASQAEWVLGSNWMMGAWIDMPTLPSGNHAYSIMGVSPNGNQQWVFVVTPSQYLNFNCYNASSYTTNVTASSLGFSTNTWYHVAARQTVAGTTKLYINGVEPSYSSTTSASVGSATNNLEIGSMFDTGSTYSYYYFNGYLDEVCLFNGAYGPLPTITDLYTNTERYRRLIIG